MQPSAQDQQKHPHAAPSTGKSRIALTMRRLRAGNHKPAVQERHRHDMYSLTHVRFELDRLWEKRPMRRKHLSEKICEGGEDVHLHILLTLSEAGQEG